MTQYALKNVPETVWHQFKSESARRGLKMGEFFEMLLYEHGQASKESRTAWDKVLKGKPLLTEDDAREMRKGMKEIRREFDFRT